jgi:predicted acetyltransferase
MVDLVAASEADREILANLLQFELHDLSEFEPQDVGADGRFSYDYLATYFEDDPARKAWLIYSAETVIGFALARLLPTDEWSIAEFFVLRAYRRQGVGRAAARAVLATHPGPWVVEFVPQDEAAAGFWRRVVGEHTAGAFVERSAEDPPRASLRFG